MHRAAESPQAVLGTVAVPQTNSSSGMELHESPEAKQIPFADHCECENHFVVNIESVIVGIVEPFGHKINRWSIDLHEGLR